jgi:hypothetical protein
MSAADRSKLCNFVWNSHRAIVNGCKTAWQFLIDNADRISSIGTREWACASR